jgi:hypothetical protein
MQIGWQGERECYRHVNRMPDLGNYRWQATKNVSKVRWIPNHMTYMWTQGLKSLGPLIRITAYDSSGTQGLKEMKLCKKESH